MLGRARCAVRGPASIVGSFGSVGTSRRSQSCPPFSLVKRLPGRSWWPDRSVVESSFGTATKTGVLSLQCFCVDIVLAWCTLTRLGFSEMFLPGLCLLALRGFGGVVVSRAAFATSRSHSQFATKCQHQQRGMLLVREKASPSADEERHSAPGRRGGRGGRGCRAEQVSDGPKSSARLRLVHGHLSGEGHLERQLMAQSKRSRGGATPLESRIGRGRGRGREKRRGL